MVLNEANAILIRKVSCFQFTFLFADVLQLLSQEVVVLHFKRSVWVLKLQSLLNNLNIIDFIDPLKPILVATSYLLNKYLESLIQIVSLAQNLLLGLDPEEVSDVLSKLQVEIEAQIIEVDGHEVLAQLAVD